MIQANHLSKKFGDLRAVDDVSFAVRKGEIYGLLGPNGAGKTTTISMLSGLLGPDAGRILFGDLDVTRDAMAVKSQLGVVPQEVALYEELSAVENLRFWGGLYGLSGQALTRAVDEVLDRVGLTARAKSKVREYSGGMQRRLNLALGIIHKPRFVLLDEPTVGIDPQARVNILAVVEELAESGTAVLYTTHYLEEAERLCHRVGIMDHGKLLAEGTLDELKRMVGEAEVITVRGDFGEDQARTVVDEMGGAQVIQSSQGLIVLAADSEGRGAVGLLSEILGGSLEVEGVSIQPPNLNGLFLKLTGRELRD